MTNETAYNSADVRDTPPPDAALPRVAIIGRPNVGKSTLLNRVIGRREAIVEERPGVTRDRHETEASWAGRRFVMVDTGGWSQQGDELDAKVSAQSEAALNEADVILMVVDATVGTGSGRHAAGAIRHAAGTGRHRAAADGNLGSRAPLPGMVIDARADARTIGTAIGGDDTAADGDRTAVKGGARAADARTMAARWAKLAEGGDALAPSSAPLSAGAAR